MPKVNTSDKKAKCGNAKTQAELFQTVEINKPVDDGVDGETCCRMNIQLAGDMFAV